MKKELRPIAFLKDPPALFITAVWAAALIFIAAFLMIAFDGIGNAISGRTDD